MPSRYLNILSTAIFSPLVTIFPSKSNPRKLLSNLLIIWNFASSPAPAILQASVVELLSTSRSYEFFLLMLSTICRNSKRQLPKFKFFCNKKVISVNWNVAFAYFCVILLIIAIQLIRKAEIIRNVPSVSFAPNFHDLK